jgi:hypothetical protein
LRRRNGSFGRVRSTSARNQEQVPIARLHVDDLELDCTLAAGEANIEVLAASVRSYVDPRLALPRTVRHRHACADGGKAPLERLARHGVSSLAAGA